jgi:phosphatidylglycerophosphate synthase
MLVGVAIFLDIIIAIGGLVVILYYRKVQRVLPILGANMYGKMKVVLQSACVGAFFYRDLFSNSDLNYYITVIFLLVTILLSCISIFRYVIIINKK